MALFGLFSKRDTGRIRFPVDVLSLVRPNRDGIPALGAPSLNEYQRLQKALTHIAEMQSIPVGAGNRFPKSHPSRIRYFFKAAGFPPSIINKMVRLHGHGSKNWRGKDWHNAKRAPSARLIKKYESDMVLKYLDDWGLTRHEQPLFAMAGAEEMFFHAFAQKSGMPNSDVLKASAIDETYEVYTVDVGSVLADQGRYDLYRGCLRIRKAAGDALTNITFVQPSGGPPGKPPNEEYKGYFFLQDDTATILSFESDGEMVDRRDDEDGKTAADPQTSEIDIRRKMMRHNLAVMVLSGSGRRGDGLYDKFVGGQLGRALTGSPGVFSSPCVLYRVTRQRIKDIESEIIRNHQSARGAYENDVRVEEIREFFDQIVDDTKTPAIDPEVKYKLMEGRCCSIGISQGVEPEYANVMSDLKIPIQRQDGPEERHVDFNFFGARND